MPIPVHRYIDVDKVCFSCLLSDCDESSKFCQIGVDKRHKYNKYMSEYLAKRRIDKHSDVLEYEQSQRKKRRGTVEGRRKLSVYYRSYRKKNHDKVIAIERKSRLKRSMFKI